MWSFLLFRKVHPKTWTQHLIIEVYVSHHVFLSFIHVSLTTVYLDVVKVVTYFGLAEHYGLCTCICIIVWNTNRKCDNMRTFAAFIDMKKTFDWVDRNVLFFKTMKHFNINGKMYDTIVSLYINSSACVILNALRTYWFDISSGVQQGDHFHKQFSPTCIWITWLLI